MEAWTSGGDAVSLSCTHCGKIIPMNIVQLNNMHMDCAEEEITVFKVRPEPGQCWVIGEGTEWIKHTIEQMNPEDFSTLEIECVKIPRVHLVSLPEHGGW